MMKHWLGIDLDGTLAHFDKWEDIYTIGKPLQIMKDLIMSLHNQGIRIKIFTARVGEGDVAIPPIKQWLKKNGLPDLEITNVKDMYCIEIWDDRAVQIEHNTGRLLGQSKLLENLPRWLNNEVIM